MIKFESQTDYKRGTRMKFKGPLPVVTADFCGLLNSGEPIGKSDNWFAKSTEMLEHAEILFSNFDFPIRLKGLEASFWLANHQSERQRS